MKKFILIILLNLLTVKISYSSPAFLDSLDYHRINSNYNGSAYNGYSILVYGSGGIIINSSDGGNNWLQVNLNDSLNILGITNIGKTFFGISSQNYTLKSSDNGQSWQLIFMGNNINYYKIIAYNDNLYCQSDSSIIVYDQYFNKTKQYNFISDTTYYDFIIKGNNIVFCAGIGKLGIISLQNDSISYIDLSTYGISDDNYTPTHLITDGTNIYFNLGYNFYRFDSNKSLSIINNTSYYTKYSTINNHIYGIYNSYDYNMKLDSLYFVKLNSNNYTLSQIKNKGNDRYISNLQLNNLFFITSDTLIAVGNNKLIYMSFDGGQNWQLKSLYSFNARLNLFDDLNSVELIGYSQFFKTKDGGITWLPQKEYHAQFAYMYYYDAAFFINKDFGFEFENLSSANDSNTVYTNDNCENVKLKNINQLSMYSHNSQYQISVCRNNNYTLIGYPAMTYPDWKFSMIYKLDDSLNVINNTFLDSMAILFIDSFDNNELFSVILNLRYPTKINNQIVYDSIYCSLISSKDAGITWQKETDINIPNISNNSIFDLFRIKNDLYLTNRTDSICFDTNGSAYMNGNTDIYKFNVYSKDLQKIFSENNFNNIGLTSIGTNTYLYGTSSSSSTWGYEIYKNVDIENKPTEWTNIEPKERYTDVNIFSKNDSLIYIYAYDSLFQNYAVWFAKPNFKTVVHEQTEVYNEIYLSESYPNPAFNIVTISIYWDMSLNIDDAEFCAYDILGIPISNKNDFYFNKSTLYNGTITWNVKNIPAGVYFINVKLGTIHYTSSVVINK